MRLLLGFLLVAVVAGMFARSMDWRAFVAFIWSAAVVAAVYQYSVGAW
jgi:biotin transporter BioY